MAKTEHGQVFCWLVNSNILARPWPIGIRLRETTNDGNCASKAFPILRAKTTQFTVGPQWSFN